MKLLLYTPQLTNRIRYLTELIFVEWLDLALDWSTDEAAFLAYTGIRINYSTKLLPGKMIFIPQHDLLIQQGVQDQQIETFEVKGLCAFFAQNISEADFSFDLFALVFYLVTRYEEYLPFVADEHGRFPAKESLAYRAGFLQEPLVDQWMLQLRRVLTEQYPQLMLRSPQYQFIPSYDIDFAWSYRHKGLLRKLGAYARAVLQLNGTELQRQLKVQLGIVQDPYYVFDYLDQLHQTRQLTPSYFFLLGDYGPFDKANQFSAQAFQALIHRTANQYPTGIHPSYASNEDPQRLSMEIARLKTATGKMVAYSRQHFLKLRFPQTYQDLIAAKVKADFSMGYAAHTGFRASLAQSFYWYDLSQEQQTKLRIYPFQVMDVTLKRYQQLDPVKAVEQVQYLIEQTKAVGGLFMTLWHNSSLTEIEGWENWRQVYEDILSLAQSEA